FYFATAPQLIYDVVDEPLQHLGDQVAGRKLLFLTEIDQLPIEAEAHGAPFVLLDHRRRIHAEREIVASQLPDLGDDRLENGGDTHRLLDARANVAHAELERGIGVVRTHVPPDL